MLDALTSAFAGADSVLAILGILSVLALLDSASLGTLLIPVWLLMAPGRLRAGRLFVYLGLVAGAYAAVGLVILGGLSLFGDRIARWVETASASPVFSVVQLALGAGLILLSLRMDPMTQAGKEAKRRRDEERGTADRLLRFRARAVGASGEGGVTSLLVLGGAAVALELPTLLPYLAGIGVVAAEGPAWPSSAPLILFYCIVMILPALVLTAARILARRVVERPLARLEAWLSRHANGTIALVLFLIGLLVGLGGLDGLGDGGIAFGQMPRS